MSARCDVVIAEDDTTDPAPEGTENQDPAPAEPDEPRSAGEEGEDSNDR